MKKKSKYMFRYNLTSGFLGMFTRLYGGGVNSTIDELMETSPELEGEWILVKIHKKR